MVCAFAAPARYMFCLLLGVMHQFLRGRERERERERETQEVAVRADSHDGLARKPANWLAFEGPQ